MDYNIYKSYEQDDVTENNCNNDALKDLGESGDIGVRSLVPSRIIILIILLILIRNKM